MARQLTPEQLLQAYAAGVFPMAENRDTNDIFWVDPEQRGIFPLDGFHISRSLRKSILRGDYVARFDTGFADVLQACANRDETWINAPIRELYLKLHQMGRAHSQEIWHGQALIGGVYGVSLGQAFFGESMFSTRRDASKIALAWLVDRLRLAGVTLFDVQFLTPHLQSLGAIEIPRLDYQERLEIAVNSAADITNLPAAQTAQDVIQRNTQTS